MNKRKLVIFTCGAVLLGFTLYFYYPRQNKLPNQEQEQEQEQEQTQTQKQTQKPVAAASFSPSSPQSDAQDNPKDASSKVELEKQLQNLKKFCEEEYPEYRGEFPTVGTLKSVLEDKNLKQNWLNLHLKDSNNRVWRLRRFIDDGENAGVERVILYKEDETGFPRIVKSSETQKKHSPQELFEKFRQKGEAIFTDEAYSNIYKGIEYFFELTNGQITRIDITSKQGHINCQVPH